MIIFPLAFYFEFEQYVFCIKKLLGGLQMSKIAIITGSTRDNRVNLQVAEYLLNFAQTNFPDHQFEIVDIKEYDLPTFNEAMPPGFTTERNHPNVKRFSQKISESDGFIFVTPEYNRATSSSLKNAIDSLYHEWNHKPAGIASYGGQLGASAATSLRSILANLKVATVASQATFSIMTDFENMAAFKPAEYHAGSIKGLFEDILLWSKAFESIR